MNNLIQNEIDVLLEIYTKIKQFEETLRGHLERTHANKIDCKFLINEYKMITNQSINTALQNNMIYDYFDYNNIKKEILPNSYVKPGYEEIIQKLYKLNKNQLDEINKQINKLIKEQK